MKKLVSAVLFAVALSAILPQPNARADSAQMRQLVPDSNRARKTDHTFIFSRSQLKYGLERDDYLNRWIDQPLFVDPKLRGDATQRQANYFPSFQRIQQNFVDYGLDGMAFFPETSGRSIAYEYSQRSARPDFKLLTEFTPNDGAPSKSDVAKMALDNPASLRFNGKLVITSYSAESKSPEYWQNVFVELKKQYGDQFIFLPSLGRFAGVPITEWVKKFNDNSVSAENVTAIKDDLRKWARATDGLYFAGISSVRTDDRRFDEDFYRDFVVRLFKSVLAEPEFTGKYFALQAMVGHENPTRVGYTFDSNGTKTLRQSLATALEAQPEIIVIPEWDEQNENTSLRPTVYNGTSSMRLLRYFTGAQKSKKPAPLPGDDVSIPNLILSFRKVLVLGEKIEIELLNVPDSATGSTPFTARLALIDLNGQTVYSSPTFTFQGDELQEQRAVLPSETLANDKVLRPRLEIENNGRTQTFEDGLHYLDLRATWNWDSKWVKQPLRDLLRPSQASFKANAPQSTPDLNNARTISASFATNEPLAYVEVLDNDNIVYIAPPKGESKENEWRENADQVIVSLNWQSRHSLSKALLLKGEIALQNATAHWLLPSDESSNARSPFTRENQPLTLQGQTLTLNNMKSSNWQGRILLAIPRAQIDKAALKISLPDLYEGTLPVRQILDDGAFGIPGPNGFNIVVSRYLSQPNMPDHLGASSVQFEDISIRPDLPNSVLHLQAIAESGRIYRSAPVLASTPVAAKEQISVYSNSAKKPVTLDVSASRVPDIIYQFDPRHGSVLIADAGRPFWGILAGYFTQATERGGGESNDGSPFIRPGIYPEGITKGAPDWVKTENGENALQFDGVGTYVILPQGVIPRRAGFTIAMDVKPDSEKGKQFLIGNRTYYMGSLVVFVDEGELTAEFLNEATKTTRVKSGLKLPAGKWSHLVIRYDQENLVFVVNGKTSKPLAIQGPGLYDTLSIVGGFGEDWFAGQIKSLQIRHSAKD
jgi:hypothetical protein